MVGQATTLLLSTSLWGLANTAPSAMKRTTFSDSHEKCDDPISPSYSCAPPTSSSASLTSIFQFPKIESVTEGTETLVLSQAVIRGFSIMAAFYAFLLLLVLSKYLYKILRRQYTIKDACAISNSPLSQTHTGILSISSRKSISLDVSDKSGRDVEAGSDEGASKRLKGLLASPFLVGLLGSPDWEVKVSMYMNGHLRDQKHQIRSILMSPPTSRPISFASTGDYLSLSQPSARVLRNNSKVRFTTRPQSTPILTISAATPEKAVRRTASVCFDSPLSSQPLSPSIPRPGRSRILSRAKSTSGSVPMKTLRHLSAPPSLDLPSFLTLRSSMESINVNPPSGRSAADTSFQSVSTVTNASSSDLRLSHLSSFPSPPGFTSTPTKPNTAFSGTLPSGWKLGYGLGHRRVSVKKSEASYQGGPTIKLVSQGRGKLNRFSYEKPQSFLGPLPIASSYNRDEEDRTMSLLKPLRATLDLTLSRSESFGSFQSFGSGTFGTCHEDDCIDAHAHAHAHALGLGFGNDHSGDVKICAPAFRLSVEDYDLKNAANAAIAGRPQSLMAILEDTGTSVDPIDMTI